MQQLLNFYVTFLNSFATSIERFIVISPCVTSNHDDHIMILISIIFMFFVILKLIKYTLYNILI